MKTYPLDKVFDTGVVYRAEADKALEITSAGTDSAGKETISVAGAPCVEARKVIAPLYKTSGNENGPLALNDLEIVVPPDRTLEFGGGATTLWRVVGTLYMLEPMEALPSGLLTRFGDQGREFYSHVYGSIALADAETWGDGDEKDIITFSVPAGESWYFDSLFEGIVVKDTTRVGAGDIGFRIYVDDQPLDIIETTMGRKGLDVLGVNLPPKAADNEVPFTLADYPIECEAGRTLRVSAINTSGGDLTAAAGVHYEAEAAIVGRRRFV